MNTVRDETDHRRNEDTYDHMQDDRLLSFFKESSITTLSLVSGVVVDILYFICYLLLARLLHKKQQETCQDDMVKSIDGHDVLHVRRMTRSVDIRGDHQGGTT